MDKRDEYTACLLITCVSVVGWSYLLFCFYKMVN